MLTQYRISRHHDGTKFENFPFCSHSRSTKYRDEANNNRKAVVACVRNAVKRPRKRSALIRIKSGRIKCVQLEIPKSVELLNNSSKILKLINNKHKEI